MGVLQSLSYKEKIGYCDGRCDKLCGPIEPQQASWLFIAALLFVTWPCHRIRICITIEATFAIAVWLCGILLRDQHHCDGSNNSVVTVLETTQPCDLVHNDEDGDDNVMDTMLS